YDQNRVMVPLQDISPWIQQATVAVEDRRFWEHNGVDGEGLARALRSNFSSGSKEGASTLTQQVVKNTLMQQAIKDGDEDAYEASIEVSISRKVKEWRMALGLEERLNERYGTECTSAPEVD